MFPLRDANPHRTTPVVTYGLIAVNLLVFVYGLQLELPEAERFLLVYSFVPQLFFENPFASAYRSVSSLFLHGGWAHLLGNMFFLFVFGDNIEDRLGRGRYLLFYLVGGVAATFLHALFTPASPVPLIGASGAVSAVLGAYIVLFPRQRVLTYIVPVFIFWLPAWLYLGYWALVQGVQAVNGLTLLGGGDSVAWWAHVGGFLYGALVVRGLERDPRSTVRS